MSDRPLFGTLVDLPNVESKVNVPQVKTVSDKQVEVFVAQELSKIDHVLDYLRNK